MASKHKLSTKLDYRGLSRQQEAFARLVADGMQVTEAVAQIYSDSASPSAYGRELLNNRKVAVRIEALQEQRDRIRELTRDTLTIKTLDTVDLAIEDKKYSAAFTGLRLTGDLQGMLTQNPIAEQTVAFLQFLSGSDSGKPAVEGTATVLDS